jgi:hypothetical protein
MTLLLKMGLIRKMEIDHMVSKFLGKEDLKMIIGAGTSIASIVTSNIYHTQHYTPISNKSILEVPTVKLFLCRLAAEGVGDQRKLDKVASDKIQGLKNSSALMRGKEVQLILWHTFQRSMNLFFT